ncbi:MAG: FtsX-like permease family protein [Nanoarchaeota archaeon]|nr:FtsX-like permease family protein [Nanoarchaeota archaeon]
MITAAFKISLNSIRQQRVRSWLTMLGIFIGIASVTTFISLGDAVNNSVQEMFEMIGGNKLIIMPGAGGILGAFMGGESTLTIDDVKMLERLGSINSVTYYVMGNSLATVRNEHESVWVMGIPSEKGSDIFTQMQGMDIVRGRNIDETEKYTAVVGYLLWSGNEIFSRPVRLRDTITVDEKDFEVVGLLSKVGTRQDDTSILIPFETASDIYNKDGKLDFIMAEVSPGFEIEKVSEIIKNRLAREHDVKKGEEDFSLQTSENIINMVGGIILLIQLVFVGVAMISMVVGGIGIMNTMYTSVIERTKQIGVMKAVGAKDSQILTIFLVESGIYGLVGGLVGGLMGYGFAKLMELGIQSEGGSVFSLSVTFSPGLILGVLLFSFVVGVVSGLLPARQASKMNPVDALRYE